jgi:hypothetical protein
MGQTGRRSIATHILAVKLVSAAAHFHSFGVARQGPWVTSVNTGKKKRKGQGFLQPRPRCSAANLLTRYNPRCRLFRYPPP